MTNGQKRIKAASAEQGPPERSPYRQRNIFWPVGPYRVFTRSSKRL